MTRSLLLVIAAASCTPAPLIEALERPPAGCVPPTEIDGLVARPISIGERVEGELDAAQLDDRFAFCARAGQWLSLDLDDDAFVPIAAFGAGSVVFGDNRLAGLDARPHTQLYVPADGVYTLALEERTATAPARYAFTLRAPAAAVLVEGLADAPLDLPAEPIVALVDGAELWGTFADAVDVDTVALPAAPAAGVVRAQLAIGGFSGNGSTVFATVELLDATGAVLASADALRTLALEAPVDAGPHALRIRTPRAPGERPFYALELAAFSPSTAAREQDDDANDDPTSADALELIDGRAQWIASLPPDDRDHFSFTIDDDATLALTCTAEAGGSGVRELVVSIVDPAGTILATSREDTVAHTVIGGARDLLGPAELRLCGARDDDCALIAQRSSGAGTYTVRLQAGSAAPDVAGRWVRCALLVSG